MVDQEKQQLPVSSDYHTTITVPMVEWACQVSQLRVSLVPQQPILIYSARSEQTHVSFQSVWKVKIHIRRLSLLSPFGLLYILVNFC